MTKYIPIIFLSDPESAESIAIFCCFGADAAIDHLSQWDMNEGEEQDVQPWGTMDKTFTKGDYVLSYSDYSGYIALTKIISE